MGDIANPGEAFGTGMSQGQGLYNGALGASREREQHGLDTQARIEDQQAIQGGVIPGSAPGNVDPAQAQSHAGFLQSIGQGLSHIGTGISNYFGGAAAQPAGAPAGQAGALPPPAPTAGGIPGPPQTMPNGGPNPTMNVPGGVAMAAEGGPIDAQTPIVPGSDGGIPNPGASLGNGAAQGQGLAGNVINASREREQHGLDQASRGAAGDAIDQSVMPGAGADQTHPIEQFAAHLHDGALNDSGVPNGKQAIAGVTPQQQLAATAQNPAAAKGIPEQTPTSGSDNVSKNGDAHSLSPEWWDQSDKMMVHAASAAARAGHDGDAVFTSLTHMRTSFIQGHMLRNLSAANQALMSGDQKGVETALKNMNYYLPDGKDLGVEKDAQGNLTYQNPLDPYIDAQGAPTTQKTDKKNMIPVDAAHLQMLGQNVLDPMKVNDITVAARSAAAKQALEAAQTHAQVVTADSKQTRANTDALLAKPRSIKLLSSAQLDQARAAAGGFAIRQLQAKYPKLDPQLLKGAQQASDAVDQAALGRKIATPTMDNDGNPSLSPAAGKNVNDPSTVSPELKNATPLELGDIKALAGDIFVANAASGVSQWRAAQMALQMHAAKGKNHPGPDGKPQPNAYIHRETGEMGIWNQHTKRYDKAKLSPQSVSTMLDGTGKMTQEDLAAHSAIAAMGGGGESADSIAPSGNPDDDLPAKEN